MKPPPAFMQWLAALVPRPRLHLIRFGVRIRRAQHQSAFEAMARDALEKQLVIAATGTVDSETFRLANLSEETLAPQQVGGRPLPWRPSAQGIIYRTGRLRLRGPSMLRPLSFGLADPILVLCGLRTAAQTAGRPSTRST